MELFSEVKRWTIYIYIYIYPRIHVNIFKPATKLDRTLIRYAPTFFPPQLQKKQHFEFDNNNNAFVARQIG